MPNPSPKWHAPMALPPLTPEEKERLIAAAEKLAKNPPKAEPKKAEPAKTKTTVAAKSGGGTKAPVSRSIPVGGSPLSTTSINPKTQGLVTTERQTDGDEVKSKEKKILSPEEQLRLKLGMGPKAPAFMRENDDMIEALRAAILKDYADTQVSGMTDDMWGIGTAATGLFAHHTGGDPGKVMGILDRAKPGNSAALQDALKDKLDTYTKLSKQDGMERLKYGQTLLANEDSRTQLMKLMNEGKLTEGMMSQLGLNPLSMLKFQTGQDNRAEDHAYDAAVKYSQQVEELAPMGSALDSMAEMIQNSKDGGDLGAIEFTIGDQTYQFNNVLPSQTRSAYSQRFEALMSGLESEVMRKAIGSQQTKTEMRKIKKNLGTDGLMDRSVFIQYIERLDAAMRRDLDLAYRRANARNDRVAGKIVEMIPDDPRTRPPRVFRRKTNPIKRPRGSTSTSKPNASLEEKREALRRIREGK